MSLAVLYSRANMGIVSPLVTVEVDLSRGLPGFSIAGLPETAVKESRYRVRSAILNSELEFPVRRITINLAPADLPKEGGRFDLAIALGILAASQQIPEQALHNYEFFAELALSGKLLPIRSVLPAILAATQDKRQVILARSHASEAGICKEASIFLAGELLQVCQHFRKTKLLPMCDKKDNSIEANIHHLDEIKGQDYGKRMLEIAAAGRHSLLFSGPPGAGKTMLARCLPSLLPPLNEEQATTVASIYSTYHVENRDWCAARYWARAPFRSPHHSISSAAMIGGSHPPQAGEVSLAHHGVLFLDELPEFSRVVLEGLREPLEERVVKIARARYHIQFPADFQLVAAMNPCPCGYYGDERSICHCSNEQIERYHWRLSGPLLDRIDLYGAILPLSVYDLLNNHDESSPQEKNIKLMADIEEACHRQYTRSQKMNAYLSIQEINKHCQLSANGQQLMAQAMKKFFLTARGYYRVLKVSRTIADLASSENILEDHLNEALYYRVLLSKKLV